MTLELISCVRMKVESATCTTLSRGLHVFMVWLLLSTFRHYCPCNCIDFILLHNISALVLL